MAAKLKICLPLGTRISVQIAPGTHDQEVSVNKQLSDKERVAAALENSNLVQMIKRAVRDSDPLPFNLFFM
jgi:hypothetical protein